MSTEHSESGTLAADERAPRNTITLRLILIAMACGFVGMVVLLPILAGVPVVLDLFRTDPLVQFSSFIAFFGLEPSLVLGVLLFVIGGTLFLPVQFIVVAAYLPPEEPRYARGVTYALIYWIGFLMVFWPGGDVLAIGLFVIASLLYHVGYGFILAYLIDRFAAIPQHAV